MRKIDKSIIKSNNYKKWLQKIRAKQKTHKTCSTYKVDVMMCLLYCQKGVCAYTEMRLCVPDAINENKWNENEYINRKYNLDKIGDLEHFDSSLKNIFHCEWDNLFMVFHEINNDKSVKNIDLIKEFKPDNEKYSPEEIFDYDINTHKFRPNSDIEDVDKIKKINKLIEIFCINSGFVKYERETFLSRVNYNKDEPIDRFYTAYNFSKKYLKP